ncbi:MAG TPA: hypothetical protein VKV20_08295 [Ktedonobacteraceae bacterium]|jgi:hypothetical protein|nr:hypothetical protein [Ktedonobacteraceae bacterium]
MTGYIGNDGSALAGGLNPSGQVQGLSVDTTGKLNVNASVSSGPTNITQINSAPVGRANGLPVGGDNGSAVVVLPLEALNNLLKTSLYGKVTNPGDTPILLDASGRLQTANYINGQAVGIATPYPSADQSRYAAVQDKAFIANYGRLSVATQTTSGYPLSIFNPAASGKDIVIYSVRVELNGAAGEFRLALTTADPAYPSAATLMNLKAGSATTSVASVTYDTAVHLMPTTYLDDVQVQNNTPFEFIPAGSGIYLPKGSANGLTVWSAPGGSGTSIVAVRYFEY